jgi:choline dehydrogenase-like flavoprotein
VVAKELAAAGMSVALLERGKSYSAADCRKDDLRNQRTTVLGNGFGPDDERNPRVLVDERGRERVLAASEGAYSNNAAGVGGGTCSYGAQAWRFMEKDFRMRSTYGPVEGSTLEDWPIGYQDLEPYYEKAEWELGVSGDSANTFKSAAEALADAALSPTASTRFCNPPNASACIPSTSPCWNTVPYNSRGPACAAAGAWASPAGGCADRHAHTVIPSAITGIASYAGAGQGSPGGRPRPRHGRGIFRSADRLRSDRGW